MGESFGLGWCVVGNSVCSRMIDDSLSHKLVASKRVRRRTKVLNGVLRRFTGLKQYSQYVAIKNAVCSKIPEDEDVDDNRSVTEDDYSVLHKSDESFRENMQKQFEGNDLSYSINIDDSEVKEKEVEEEYEMAMVKADTDADAVRTARGNECTESCSNDNTESEEFCSVSERNSLDEKILPVEEETHEKEGQNVDTHKTVLETDNTKCEQEGTRSLTSKQSEKLRTSDIIKTRTEDSVSESEDEHTNEILAIKKAGNAKCKSIPVENIKKDLTPALEAASSTIEKDKEKLDDEKALIHLSISSNPTAQSTPLHQQDYKTVSVDTVEVTKISIVQTKDSGIDDDSQEEFLEDGKHSSKRKQSSAASLNNTVDIKENEEKSSEVQNNAEKADKIKPHIVIETNESKQETEEMQKHKLKVTCTEILNKKFKIVNRDGIPSKNSENQDKLNKSVESDSIPEKKPNTDINTDDEVDGETCNTDAENDSVVDTETCNNATELNAENPDLNQITKPEIVAPLSPNLNFSEEEEDQDVQSLSPSAAKRLQQLTKLNLTVGGSSSSSEDENPKKEGSRNTFWKHNGNANTDDELQSTESDRSFKRKKNNKNESNYVKADKKDITQNMYMTNGIIKDNKKNSIFSSTEAETTDSEFKKKKKKKKKEKLEEQSVSNIESSYGQENNTNSLMKKETEIEREYKKKKKSKTKKSSEQTGFLVDEISNYNNSPSTCTNQEKDISDHTDSLFYERPSNLQELVDRQELVEEITAPSFTLKDFSEEDDIFILNIPRTIVVHDLKGERMVLKDKKLKIGKDKYEISYVNPNSVSCVFNTRKKRKRYKTVNIKPVSSIVVRRKLPPQTGNVEMQTVDDIADFIPREYDHSTNSSRESETENRLVDTKKSRTSKRKSDSMLDICSEEKEERVLKKKRKQRDSYPETTRRRRRGNTTSSEF